MNYLSGTLTIAPRNITVKGNDWGKTYGQELDVSTVGYTATNLVNGETVTSVTMGVSNDSSARAGNLTTADAGTYTLTPAAAQFASSTGASHAVLNQDYNVTYDTGNLIVDPKVITLIANSQSKVYGNTLTFTGLEYGLTTGGGLIGGDTLDTATAMTLSSTGAIATGNVGTYAINLLGTPLIKSSNGVDNVTGNYRISLTSGTLTVTPRPITITPTVQNKTYGQTGNLGTTGFTISDSANGGNSQIAAGGTIVNSDVISSSILSSTGTVATAHAGSYDITASNAAFSSGSASNYAIMYAPASSALVVDPLAIILRAQDQNKTYGDNKNLGTTGFSIQTAYGNTYLPNGDGISGVTLTSTGADAAARRSDGNQGIGKYAITITEGSEQFASGTRASDYQVLYSNDVYTSGSLTVTSKTITASVNNATTTYGTVAATTATLNGLVNSDTVIAGVSTNAYNDPVGAYAINVTGTLYGADKDNYQLATTGNSAGTLLISPKELTLSPIVNTKIYDKTTNATIADYGISGLVGGETVNVSSMSASFADYNAGTGKSVTITGIYLGNGLNGGIASNYTLANSVTAAGNITPRSIVITAVANTKTYDGTTTALAIPVISAGSLVTGDTGVLSESYATKDAGSNKTLIASYAISDQNGGNNYAVAYINNNTGLINKANISAVTGIIASNKIYDGNRTATLTTGSAGFTGMVSGDNLTVVTATGSFADKNAANNKAVSISGITLGGMDAGNYDLTNDTASTIANISKADISAVTGISAINKTYDGNRTVALTTTTAGFTGMVSGDNLTVATATGIFADKNAANDKTVSISGITLDGSDVGNYNLTNNTASTTANITKADISAVTGITASNKTYDGNRTAALTTTTAGFTGMVSGDNLTVATATGIFADKNAANGKTVSISGITLNGSDAVNYNLTNDTASTIANISKADISAVTGITAINKTYDGNRTAALTTGSAGFTGMITNDNLTVATATGSFANKNAADNKAVSIRDITLGGTDAGNYNLISTTVSTTANINKKSLTMTGTTATDKTYDGTTAANLNLGNLSGFVGSETVTATAVGNFDTKNAGTGKDVTVVYRLSDGVTGDLASNYSLANTTTTADVNKKTITITGITAQDKTYDGTTTAALNTNGAGLANLVTGDTVSLTTANAQGAFDNATIGTGKTVTVSGLELGGTEAGNYQISSYTTTANINSSQQIDAARNAVTNQPFTKVTQPANNIVATGTASNGTGVVQVVQGGINTEASNTTTTNTTPPANTMPATGLLGNINLVAVGGQTQHYTMTITAQAVTISLPNTTTTTNIAGDATPATNTINANNVVLVAVGGQGTSAIVDTCSVSSTGSSLTVTSTAGASQESGNIPQEPASGAKSETFKLSKADGSIAEFSVTYADGAISIKPLNAEAVELSQDSGAGLKVLAAIGLLIAQDKLGAQANTVGAVYINKQIE